MPDPALHRSNKTITAPVIRLDELRGRRIVGKRPARLRDRFLEDAFSCEDLGPNGLQELFLGHHAVVMLSQIAQDPNGPRLQRHDTIIAKEKIDIDRDRKRSKAEQLLGPGPRL